MKISVIPMSRCRSRQQVQHLRPDRHVERGHRLVGDDHLRLERDRAGHADALALAAENSCG